jgi:peptide/nickel transport system substrate-binding protein
MKKLIIVVSLLAILSFLMGSCGTKETSTSATTTTTTAPATTEPKYGGTLRILPDASPNSPVGWPWEAYGNQAFCVEVIFEPLLRSDGKGGVVPWLAEKYSIADDFSSITFTLRQDVKFTDGSALNAEVAKWCLDNAIEAGKGTYWKSVEIVDNYTVRINLSQWNHTVLSGLGDNMATWMVSYEAFKAHDKDWMRMNPVGTGPFKFESFTADSNYKVVRNDNYWGKDAQKRQLPYLEGITYMFSTDISTRSALMLSGEADVMSAEPDKQASDMEAAGLRYVTNVHANMVIIFDTANHDSPFANKGVREALEYAIDREAIATGYSYGYWKAPYQLAAQDTGAAALDPNYVGRRYDPDKAKQLLTDAGYPNGFSCTLLVIPVLDSDILVAIQSNLSKVNITMTLQNTEMGKWMAMRSAPLTPGTIYFEPWDMATSFSSILPNPYSAMFEVNWEITPEYKTLYDAYLNTPTEDINLAKGLLKYLQDECLAFAFSAGGKSWVEQTYVKDAGWNRGFVTNWTPEKCWFNK